MSFVAEFNSLPLESLVKKSLSTGTAAVYEAAKRNAPFFVISGLTGEGVTALVHRMGDLAMGRPEGQPWDRLEPVPPKPAPALEDDGVDVRGDADADGDERPRR